jgi:hypothetical protein
MSQGEKAAYFKALKEAGVKFDKHYREYSTEQLKHAYDTLAAAATEAEPVPPVEEPPPTEFFFPPPGEQVPIVPTAPVSPPNPTEMAGERLNTKAEDEPIRTDEQGRIWYQEEIPKPAYPKPRGRRVLTYLETGVEKESIRVGDYVETFEVAGKGPAQTAEVKITLPSYQVGIYRDPRFPFRIHVYNGLQGFDLFEVHDFYGGPELVPQEVKRVYVENVLCYDIRTTVRAIETEFRQLQLAGKVP